MILWGCTSSNVLLSGTVVKLLRLLCWWCLLFILTSKWVLCTMFTEQNNVKKWFCDFVRLHILKCSAVWHGVGAASVVVCDNDCCIFWPANGCFAHRWLNEIIFSYITFSIFFHHKWKKKKKHKNKEKYTIKGGYQRLVFTLRCWLTPKPCSTSGENVIFFYIIEQCLLFR